MSGTQRGRCVSVPFHVDVKRGDRIIYDPNQDACESERGTIVINLGRTPGLFRAIRGVRSPSLEVPLVPRDPRRGLDMALELTRAVHACVQAAPVKSFSPGRSQDGPRQAREEAGGPAVLDPPVPPQAFRLPGLGVP